MTDELHPLEQKKLEAEINSLKFWSPFKAIITAVTGLATAGAAYYGLLAPSGPLQKQLELEKKELEIAQLGIRNIFTSVINEPSGIARTCQERNGNDYFLVVDDDEDAPLLVQRAGDDLVPIAVLPLRDEEKLEPKDLEAVSALQIGADCAQWRYLVSSSHRRYGKKRETRVISFSLMYPHNDEEQFKAVDVRQFSFAKGIKDYFKDAKKPLAPYREVFLPRTAKDEPKGCKEKNKPKKGVKSRELNGMNWAIKSEKEKDKLQKYALEIEATSQLGDGFFVGLKWPLVEEKAILLSYSLDHIAGPSALKKPVPSSHILLDLGNQGITAIGPYGTCAIIASNPPMKKATDRSALHLFKLPLEGNPFPLDTNKGSINFPGKDLKLEGIAAEEDTLWAVYDGGDDKKSLIKKYDIHKLFDRAHLRKCDAI